MSTYDYGSRQGKFSGMPHYSIEQRCGCIAIVTPEYYDSSENGLHDNSTGVVWFKMGEQCNHTCKYCGHLTGQEWVVPQGIIDEAVKEADRLNALKELGEAQKQQPTAQGVPAKEQASSR